MICLIHGYALSGSGSNLWTRLVAQALCRNGETVHVICQEPRPEELDFVAASYRYDERGERETVFEREVPYEGRCIVHRPKLDLLPVYVRPGANVTSMKSILDLAPGQIAEYLDRNERAVLRIVRDEGITALHVNHVVLMAEVARRVSERTGVPFAVMPHGSAIEYVVRQDPEMQRLASRALAACDRIFVLSDEMRERVGTVFPELTDAGAKMVRMSAGVNTALFRLIPRSERRATIEELKRRVEGVERGKTPAYAAMLFDRLSDDLTQEELKAILKQASDYVPRHPDADLEAKLDGIDWERSDVLVFTGRLIAHKGVPSIVAALPEILERNPGARLILAGRGPLREVLEALLWALAGGKRRLARNIARWGSALEGEEPHPFAPVEAFFDRLEAENRLDDYFARAARQLRPDRVVFTGYLEHELLCLLFPCCDVAIFPSVVAEASPLVVPEAMASGCFPMGTYFAGMAASLDVAARALPPDAAPYLRLRPEPEHTVADVVRNVPAALREGPKHREAFRDVAVRHFEWRNIARRLSEELHGMKGG